MRRRFFRARTPRSIAVSVALALGCVPLAFAVDGVIELNQATAGGTIVIDQPGSYRLTSDLVLAGDSGVRIYVDNVTLDLNGFEISSSNPQSNDGIVILAKGTDIRNGTVRGFGRHGIFGLGGTGGPAEGVRVLGVTAVGNTATGINLEGEASLVDGCIAVENGGTGIIVGHGSLIVNSVARLNAGVGLNPRESGYRSNVATENNGGNQNAQVLDGFELGPNLCGTDTICP